MTQKQIIEALYEKTGIIDGGRCAVCRVGYRYWKTDGSSKPAGPCSNSDCLSHEIERVLSQDQTK